MNLNEADQVVQTLKEQVVALQNEVFQANAAKLAAFEADKPRLKGFLQALNQQRADLKKEIAQLQAVAANASSVVPLQPKGSGMGAVGGMGKQGMSDQSILQEIESIQQSLSTIDSRIEQARRELSVLNPYSEEKDIWETNLIMLQDTKRLQKEELALLDLEIMSRQRLAQASADKAAAEASGELAVARASEKLLQLEARIDRVKQQLFFPACKGYTFALGSGGVYFGGKDLIVSEISGQWALKAEAGLRDKKGKKGARLTLQIGVPQPPQPVRQRNSMGTTAVSDSLKINLRGRASQPSVSRVDEEEEGDESSTSSQPRPPKPEEVGNTRGKRMAMKFVNKIASKEKYTQGLKGVGNKLSKATHYVTDKAKSTIAESPKSQSGAPLGGGVRASMANKLSKAKTATGKGMQALSTGMRQLGSSASGAELSSFHGSNKVSNYAGLGPTGTAQDDLAEAVNDDSEAEWTDLASASSLRKTADLMETGSSRSGGGADASSVGNKQGMLVAVRCMEVGLVGEKGSKVPNFSLQELSLEMDFQMTISWQFDPVLGWRSAGKPVFEINSLSREVSGNTVPLPKTLLKFILTLVIPRVIRQKIQEILPVELGNYLANATQGVHVTGEISIVGPALSSLDAELAFQQPQNAATAKDARRNAAHHAAAQEARNMLGLSFQQAQVMAELFGGRLALLSPPRPCTLGALQAYYSVFSPETRVWEQLGAVWSTASRMTGNVYQAGEPPDFLKLMNGTVAQLALKPVRARLQVNRMDVSINVDLLSDALHDYFVRSAKEAHSKGFYLDLDAENPESTLPEGYQPLEVQLQALEAFHTWWTAAIRGFKSQFKEAGGTWIAAADARSFSTGIENARYEGPIKLEFPIPIQGLDQDGAWSFQLPLPNPERQETIARFVDGMRAAIATPVSLTGPAHQAGEIERTSSVWESTPAEWFASMQDSTLGKAFGDAATSIGPLPESLGTVIVNGMRVRLKLDESRLAEMVQGMNASAIPGLLRHLGDLASMSFAPYLNEDTGETGYKIRIQSSDAANLNLEAVALGYRSGEGISPGRLLKTAQALARAIMLTLHMDLERIKEVDTKMEEVYDVLIRDALDASASLEGLACKENGNLILQCQAAPGDLDTVEAGTFTNDLDLAVLASQILNSSYVQANDNRIAKQMGFGKR